MALSESELKCREAFDAFLRIVLPKQTLRWNDGANPPDLDLFVDETRYAVEVTMVMKKEVVGSVQLPMQVIAAELQDVVAEAETSIREANLLHGTFVARCPRPIAQLGPRRPEIVARLWDAVGRLWGAPAGSEAIFLREGGRNFSVTKASGDGSKLHLGGPSRFLWRGEAVQELRALVEERIATKVERLRNVAAPAILLLDERYPFADARMYTEIGCAGELVERFAAIFVVRTGVSGVLLHSRLPSLRGVWGEAMAT